MASLLESAIKKRVAQATKGRLTVGKVQRDTPSTRNAYGDVIPGTPTEYACEGIRESFTARYKMEAGIPDTDVKILLMLGSMSITPKQDDKVYLNKPWLKWHQVRKVLEIDPAGATALLQAYEIETPS